MDLSIDLRYLFLPVVNLISFILFRRPQYGNSWDVQDGINTILFHPILKLQFRFVIPAVTMPVLLFLHTPIRLAFNVRRSISMVWGEPSVLLAISAVGSVILSPFIFFVAYLCLIISSLCYTTVASLSQHIFNRFRNLTVITSITRTIWTMINRLTGNQEIAEQVDEENTIEAERNHIQNLLPGSTDDDENNLEVVVT